MKKGRTVLRKEKVNLFKLIDKNRDGRNVSQLCNLYGVTTGGYYAWKKRSLCNHRQHDFVLMDAINEIHQGYRRAYGAPRMHQELRNKGLSCSVRRVNRLMREMEIKASTTGLYYWRPGKYELYSSVGNQLSKASPATSTCVQWAGDFTYIRTTTGWLYHAVVMDLFSRRIVGWSFSRQRNTELTKSALMMALSRHRVESGCIFHSDQGIEYAAHGYRDLVQSAGMTRSMSRKGNPLDNAKVESFFHSMKSEIVHQTIFKDPIDAVANIIEYIEFYNRERLHSGLGYQSPQNYEMLCA